MPPKRSKGCESSDKATTRPSNKRARLDDDSKVRCVKAKTSTASMAVTSSTKSVSVASSTKPLAVTSAATRAAATLTELASVTSSTAQKAVTTSTKCAVVTSPMGGIDPSLQVDYDETTPLPSPKSEDEGSGWTAKRGDELESSVASPSRSDDYSSASLLPSSPKERCIHNGSPGSDELEEKISPTALKRAQSKSLARRTEGRYDSGVIPPMPPPSEWPQANGSATTL